MAEALVRDAGFGAALDEASIDPHERRRREIADRAALIGALGNGAS